MDNAPSTSTQRTKIQSTAKSPGISVSSLGKLEVRHTSISKRASATVKLAGTPVMFADGCATCAIKSTQSRAPIIAHILYFLGDLIDLCHQRQPPGAKLPE
jgi:hypothetical protein